MRLNLRIPQNNNLKHDVFEEFLGALHFMTAKFNKPIFFGIENDGQSISFYISSADQISEVIKSQLFAFFPDFQVIDEGESGVLGYHYTITLAGKKHKKIKTYKESEIKVVPSVISELPAHSCFEINVLPVKYDARERLKQNVQKIFASDLEREKDDKFVVGISYSTDTGNDHTADSIGALLNRLCKRDINRFDVSAVETKQSKGNFFLSKQEVATIFYFPYQEAKVSQIRNVQFSTAEPPEDLPTLDNVSEDAISLVGRVKFRGVDKMFGIKRTDRDKHLYIVGKSGMGKSFLLKLLMLADIQAQKGLAFIDPHGDPSKMLISMIPQNRLNDVIYFDCTDFDYPIGFNPLANISKKYKHNAVDSFVEIFEKRFGVYWNSRLEHIFRYATLALLDSPEPNLMGLKNLLTDKDYRQFVIKNTKDPVVKAFWANEFADWKTKYESDSVLPIINKLSQLLANPILRNIFIQTKNTLDMKTIMDMGKILICNLSSGEIGEENMSFIGSMLVTKLQQAAMERVSLAKESRKDFYLYVDEFQNFATESFIKIFSEARKYNLSLTVAHQYIKQLPEPIKDTVFGNVGSIIMFRLGMQDAEELVKEFSPQFSTKDMVNLGIRDIYVKLCIDGKTSKPFSASTLTLPKCDYDHSSEIIKNTRSRYARKVSEVESLFEKQNKRYKMTDEFNFEEPII